MQVCLEKKKYVTNEFYTLTGNQMFFFILTACYPDGRWVIDMPLR
jgi:hypothetical protein